MAKKCVYQQVWIPLAVQG